MLNHLFSNKSAEKMSSNYIWLVGEGNIAWKKNQSENKFYILWQGTSSLVLAALAHTMSKVLATKEINTLFFTLTSPLPDLFYSKLVKAIILKAILAV